MYENQPALPVQFAAQTRRFHDSAARTAAQPVKHFRAYEDALIPVEIRPNPVATAIDEFNNAQAQFRSVECELKGAAHDMRVAERPLYRSVVSSRHLGVRIEK